jgi:hypothetical protein
MFAVARAQTTAAKAFSSCSERAAIAGLLRGRATPRGALPVKVSPLVRVQPPANAK